MSQQNQNIINTRTVAHCPVCTSEGQPLYHELRDRLFHVPGKWRMMRCGDAACGMLWLNPAPHPDDLSQCYQQYHTHATEKDEAASARVGLYERWRERVWSVQYPADDNKPGWRQRLMAMLLRCIHPVRLQLSYDRMYLTPTPGGRLLDVGCGDGTLMRHLQRLGWSVQGLDPDPAAVAAACDAGLDVQQGTIDGIDFEADAFDAVIMTHVIEHVPDAHAVLQACRRVLKPTGQLVIVTPNNTSWCHRLFGEHWRGLEPPRHLQIFNVGAMRRILCDTGFSAVRVRTSARDASGMYAASHALRSRGYHHHGQKPSASVRLRGDLLLSMQAVAVAMGIQAGEELVATAEKPR